MTEHGGLETGVGVSELYKENIKNVTKTELQRASEIMGGSLMVIV